MRRANKRQTTIRLSEVSERRIEYLAERWETSKAAAIEQSVRKAAKAEGWRQDTATK